MRCIYHAYTSLESILNQVWLARLPTKNSMDDNIVRADETFLTHFVCILQDLPIVGSHDT